MKSTTTFAFSAACLTLAFCFSFEVQAAPVTFDWATVGNPGNADDTHGAGYGGVANSYRISKTEVTNAQYTEFLNAVDPTAANSLSLFNSSMAGNFGGIENTGTTDGSRYVAQAGREQNPVTYVSFFDAMRFTNWLENGQGSGNTESGVYTIGSGADEVRNPNATFFIPSEDEWYKAAYYDPSGTYFDYATGSDTVPVSDQPGDDPAAVNYFNNDGLANGFNDGYAVSGSTSFSTNPFTDVGAYTSATSPYGTFDQSGNVWEWNEAVISSSFRGIRGGSWASFTSGLAASFRIIINPTAEIGIIGFRVASIPEPSSLLLGAMASVGLLMRRRRLS